MTRREAERGKVDKRVAAVLRAAVRWRDSDKKHSSEGPCKFCGIEIALTRAVDRLPARLSAQSRRGR